MPSKMELRNRKSVQRTSSSDTETDTELNTIAGVEPKKDEDVSRAQPKQGHSKGESKMSKLLNRLVFGCVLLLVLCCVIAAGHLATLGLVVRS